jgi:hypothetical protein
MPTKQRVREIVVACAKLIGIPLGIVGAAVGIFVAMMTYLTRCDAEVYTPISAPNGKSFLIVAVMNCGATTPFYTDVKLASGRWSFWQETSPAFFTIRGQHDLAVRWVNERTIEIVIPEDTPTKDIYRKEQVVDCITIEYK